MNITRPDFCIVFITAANLDEGHKIAQALLQEKLVACVNVINNVESCYWWQGKIESSQEVLLISKTMAEKLSNIKKLVSKIHSYTVPEVISIPIVDGSEKYLNWIKESVS